MHSSCSILKRPSCLRRARVAASACTSAASTSAKPRCSLATAPFRLPSIHSPTPTGTSPTRILQVTTASLNSHPPAWPPSHASGGHQLIPCATMGSSGTSHAAPAGRDEKGAGGPADPSTLGFWEQQVAQLPYRQAQALLSARGLRAAGPKEEVQLRLAQALLGEHAEGSTPTDVDTPGVRELLAAEAQASSRQRLRAELARKLRPGHLAAFQDVHLDLLINIYCINLDVLALLSAEDLGRVGLPVVLIRVLQLAGLIGGAAGGPGLSTGEDRVVGAVGEPSRDGYISRMQRLRRPWLPSMQESFHVCDTHGLRPWCCGLCGAACRTLCIDRCRSTHVDPGRGE